MPVVERIFRATILELFTTPTEFATISKSELGPNGIIGSEQVAFPIPPIRSVLGSSYHKGSMFYIKMEMIGPHKARVLVRKDRHSGNWILAGDVQADDHVTRQTLKLGSPDFIAQPNRPMDRFTTPRTAQEIFDSAPNIIDAPPPASGKIILPGSFQK
jgi:hypothetical protein